LRQNRLGVRLRKARAGAVPHRAHHRAKNSGAMNSAVFSFAPRPIGRRVAIGVG
jgi:hypothetical protein